uniref:Protein FAM33A n=1 Tax=Fagus sylvatica TaxID=28930 RepID=A0A2N9FT68_FAGSY
MISSVVQHRLEKEFQQVYRDNENPMKLVFRIKKVQEDLLTLKEQCRELLKAKQDVIDKARTTLVGNRTLLQQMQASMGITLISDSDDPAFANFNQIVDEWEAQVRLRTGNW